jgi:hypothetical protein
MFKRIAAILLLIFFAGCTHKLEIKNLDSYRNTHMNSLDKPLTIGVIPTTCDIHGKKLVKGICTELGKYSADVLLPYTVGSSRCVDVKAKIVVLSEYKGSGWNFLINWPGFLIFTPAWHGYNYGHKYNIEVLLIKASDNQKIDSFNIPINLSIRHADIGRTWTEIGWLEVSLIPFIGGFVFIGYDDDITNPVLEKIETPVGDYIAQEIVSRINNFGDLGPIVKDSSKTKTTKTEGPDSETISLAEMKKELKDCEEMKAKGLITDLECKELKAKIIDKF